MDTKSNPDVLPPEQNQRVLTFGQKAVGITFNVNRNPDVNNVKQGIADSIDYLHKLRSTSENGEVKRMLSVAITELQSAQMWAVKAITWEY